MHYLAFEKPVEALIASAAALRAGGHHEAEAAMLDERASRQLADIYAQLTPWQRTLVARHPARPHFGDLVQGLFADFLPLSGDRRFGDDPAIIGGFARLGAKGHGRRVMLIGHEKGHDTATRIKHNFGMGKPEGYRKAIRLMELAGRFGLPVVTLVDTSGAFPGIEAEERGQAEAIARSTEACLNLPVPMVAVIVGEGGSGGAVALASAERVLMLEHSIYTVASPEASASILWRDSGRAQDAATNMKITAQDLLRFGIIDTIVPEPVGGAHRDNEAAINAAGKAIEQALGALRGLSGEEVRRKRADKFLNIGRKI